jgi:hypothetical protein
MTNKKQSSVEQMWEELDNLIPFKDNATAQKFSDILDKYKAMHKEEIEMAYINGQQVNSKSLTSLMMIENSESYYNETFGGNNE